MTARPIASLAALAAGLWLAHAPCARAADAPGGATTAPPPSGAAVGAVATVAPTAPPPRLQPARRADDSSWRYGFARLRLGPALPLAGTLATEGTLGGAGIAEFGLESASGVSVGFGFFNDWQYYRGESYTLLTFAIFGMTLRYAMLRELALHPFVEVGASVRGATPLRTGRYVREGGNLAGAASLGVEIDLSARVSLEIGAQMQLLVMHPVTASGVVFTPFAGLSLHFCDRFRETTLEAGCR